MTVVNLEWTIYQTLHIVGQWEESEVPAENPHTLLNKQTPSIKSIGYCKGIGMWTFMVQGKNSTHYSTVQLRKKKSVFHQNCTRNGFWGTL